VVLRVQLPHQRLDRGYRRMSPEPHRRCSTRPAEFLNPTRIETDMIKRSAGTQ
jgi:hypothetical protein